MNSKMTTNSQLSKTEPENKTKTHEANKQEQKHRNGDPMEGYQWGVGGEEWEEGKAQGIRSITGRHKTHGERLSMV